MTLDARRVLHELSDPFRRRRQKALRSWLCVLAWIVATSLDAHAQHADPRDQAPTLEPLFSLDSPLGSIDYVAGRGLHLGRTGLTVGGFSTVELNRDEGGPAFLDLDGVNFLVLWEPVDFFTAFTELEVGDLFSLNLEDGHVASDATLQVERLYGDLSWNDALNGRLGKFQTPVGIWNLVPAEPFTWTATDPVLVETAFDEHQSGGALYGTFYPGSQTLEYWIYGQFFDPLDPSDTPAPADHSVGGRLRYAGEVDDWAVGASYLSSQRDGRWNYLGGLDAFWDTGPVELQGEFAVVRGEIPDRNQWDVYVQGVYDLGDAVSWLRSLNLVARYEHFAPRGWSQTSNIWDLGAAWLPKHFLVLKAGYRLADQQSDEVHRGFFASFSVLF